MAKQKKTKDEVLKAFHNCGLDVSKLQLMHAPTGDQDRPDYYILLNSEKGEVVMSNVSGSKLMDIFDTVEKVTAGTLPCHPACGECEFDHSMREHGSE